MSDTASIEPEVLAAAPTVGLEPATANALLHRAPTPIALCDGLGRVEWCNPALLDLTGADAATARGQPLAQLLRLEADDAQRLQQALRSAQAGPLGDVRIATRWWRAQLGTLADGRRAVHWQAADEQRRQAAEAARLSELLDLAQDFGRLAVWERDTRTLQGWWDHHMHRIWGLAESDGAPGFDQATQSVVEEDRALLRWTFRESIRHAGSYAHRYRVRGSDGVVRQLHSQWLVKNGTQGTPERALGIVVDDTEALARARSDAEAAEQLNLALTLAHVIVFRHELHSDRVRITERAFELGLPEGCADLSSAQLRELVHADDHAALRSATEQALGSRMPVDAQIRFRHADGGWRHVLTRRIAQRDAQGQPVALLGVGLDISERVHATQRETELVRQFELTAHAAGIGYWSVLADTAAARWSDQTFALHGLPAGGSAPSTAEWLRRFVHPGDRDAVRQRYRQWAKSGGPTLEQELRIVRSDGATRHLLSYSRLEGPPGRHDFYGVLVDVTERHAAETALHRASERAALATRGAGMGTWEQDLLSGQPYWDEQMWRLRGLQPRPQPLSVDERMALVHPDDRDATLHELMQATLEARASYLEYRVRWPDGQWRLLASRSVAVRDEHGQPTRRIGINWDITDARQAQIAHEEKLRAERESRAKSQFMSRMSHELRTPLNAVLGFTQLLLGDAPTVPGETRRRRLEQIQRAGQHLLSLIDDVLELSSIEGGELSIRSQPVVLAQLLAETLPLVAANAQQRKVALHNRVEAGVALADTTRLRQVLLNLLTNAVKYNREGGQVTVESHPGPGTVLLRVSDSGRGMDAAQLQQAFEPFNRLGAEHEGIEGTGIGLGIVKALVERMGGSLHASSTPGQGSVFDVTLPDGAPSQARAERHAAASIAPPSRPSERHGAAALLYIEDNPVNLLIVQELLGQHADVRLHTASNGLDGVRMAREALPELILVDMQLPDIDGLEVLRRLRADAATAAIRCIAVSANAMPGDIQRALQAGFADYWTKPLDLARFMQSLRAILGVRH